MDKLATGSSIETGWQIIARLKEATKVWPPPNDFALVLREPGKVEVWTWSLQRPQEVKFLKEIIKDFVEGR